MGHTLLVIGTFPMLQLQSVLPSGVLEGSPDPLGRGRGRVFVGARVSLEDLERYGWDVVSDELGEYLI